MQYDRVRAALSYCYIIACGSAVTKSYDSAGRLQAACDRTKTGQYISVFTYNGYCGLN